MPDYNSWEDKNDTEILDYYLNEMKKRHGVVELRALCFTHDDETIHHWNYFAKEMTGCCIEFDYKGLVESFEPFDVIHGVVKYYKINELEKGHTPPLSKLPFSKRWPYRVEHEYRIIHQSDKKLKKLEVDIDLKIIRKITISQKMPVGVAATIKEILGKDVEIVNRSTILKNKKWLRLVKDNA